MTDVGKSGDGGVGGGGQSCLKGDLATRRVGGMLFKVHLSLLCSKEEAEVFVSPSCKELKPLM